MSQIALVTGGQQGIGLGIAEALVALEMISGFAELGRAVGRPVGRPVGREFRLVGFDDIEDCAQVYPALTSVRCNIAGFGESIASTVLRWLEDGVSPASETRSAVELVIRASSTGSGA